MLFIGVGDICSCRMVSRITIKYICKKKERRYVSADTSTVVTNIVTDEDRETLKNKIEKVLSEILSDRYESKITLTFTKQSKK